MNTTGFIRGYMAKGQENEMFLNHVTNVIERQLKEWDEEFKVVVSKSEDYTIFVQCSTYNVQITISRFQLASLQSRSPYALDHYIWTKLKDRGLEFGENNGNYLDYVFM